MATVPGFGNFTLSINGEDVSGKRSVKGTGGWQFWEPIAIENVYLETGVHVMHFDFDSDSDKTGWLFSLNYIDVEVSEFTGLQEGPQLPTQPQLSQNYPNPFNPQTEIAYGLPEQSDVQLRIYDLKGRLIREWSAAAQSAGWHSLTWDGRNMHKQSVSSGVYLYQLRTAGRTLTRKMLFMK